MMMIETLCHNRIRLLIALLLEKYLSIYILILLRRFIRDFSLFLLLYKSMKTKCVIKSLFTL